MVNTDSALEKDQTQIAFIASSSSSSLWMKLTTHIHSFSLILFSGFTLYSIEKLIDFINIDSIMSILGEILSFYLVLTLLPFPFHSVS